MTSKAIFSLIILLFIINTNHTIAQTISADLIIHNATIYTMNVNAPTANALAVSDGIIIAIGSESDVMQYADDNTEIIDLDGLMLMPGFQDPHLHVLEAGMNESACFLEAEATYEEYIRELRNCSTGEDGEWIRAAGVSMAHLLLQDRLPIEVLDEAFPNNPVMVLDNLGHGAWVNTRAMQLVGYDTMEGNPQGGIIVRDSATGQLTGVLLENAQQSIRSASFPPTEENLNIAYDGLMLALEVLAENGITTVSDAGGYWTRGHDTVWNWALQDGTLSVRASNALYLFPDIPYDQQIAELRSRFNNDADSPLRFNQVKIYVDGILSQGTGALLAPYDQTFGMPDVPNDGFLYFDIETLNRYVTDLDAIGFQVHIHVTGDRGARIALDAIEQAQMINGNNDRRHRITHLFLVDEADHNRFVDLGVFADFQLAPSAVEDENIEYMYDYIDDRAEDLLPFFELASTGASIVISSDWDADELSPFVKIQTILEIDEDNELSLDQILQMMTLNVAQLLHHDTLTGSLEVGKYADMIVIDQNLFEIDTNQISQSNVLLTFLGGEIIYER